MPEADRTPSAASDLEPGDVQRCGDEQPHEAHPWSDVFCPGRSGAQAPPFSKHGWVGFRGADASE